MTRAAIKVSGTLVHSVAFLSFLHNTGYCYPITIVCGGGDQANAVLLENGYEPRFDENRNRITKTEEEHELVIKSHLDTAAKLQKRCNEFGLEVEVLPSVFWGVNTNADILFDKLIESGWYDPCILVTTPERFEKKSMDFAAKHARCPVSLAIYAITP